MAPRRLTPSSNSLNVTDQPSSPSLFHFPRATSPSGITQLLTKPSKWFRSPSGSKNLTSSAEPRSSTSSVNRKHKISQPTDPRPILSTLHSDSYVVNGAGSRSVLDLSMSRPGAIVDDIPSMPPTPTSPGRPLTPSRAMGDLRNISRRPWSKSADDLGRVSTDSATALPSLAPLDTNLHEKIQLYRNNRSDSVTSSTPSSMSTPIASHRNVEFPSIITASPSSSPPQSGGVLASSGSAPTALGPSQGLTTPTHVRSHSFTPRVASKLAPPKLGLIPPSPVRKGSASSERDLDVSVSATSTRGAFPFGRNASSKSSSTATTPVVSNSHKSISGPSPPPAPLLDPPIIIEPTQADNTDQNEKRTSQIIYHSGFVNRLGQFSPASIQQYAHQYGTGALAKGWKPFKLVLKGSKLYFYKPPNDRAAAVKELFPTELVAALEEGGVTPDEISQNDGGGFSRAKGKEREEGRRKRAFWGRRTHPDLVHGDSGVQSGTLDALVHEAAFGTTFISKQDGDPQVTTLNAQWTQFSSAVILCLPQLVERAKFESEFLRCCSFLVSGAQEDQRADESAKVYFIANEYLKYHRKPVDVQAWEEWRKETIPDFPTLSEYSAASSSGVPQSSSTQALYTPSPALGENLSPNLGMFSPRPGQTSGPVASLLEALDNGNPSPTNSFVSQMPSSTKHAFWNALEQDGLTRDIFLGLDHHLIASSLNVFHRSIWERTPEDMTADVVIGSEDGASALDDGFLTFFGSESRPHWLTKTILLQIFGQDSSTGGLSNKRKSMATFGDDRATARGHSRSDVISAWVRIGDLSRQLGDECSWKAISSALFSRPIARLEKVWKRVDLQALAIAESWVHPGPDGNTAPVSELRQTPWGGEVREKVKQKISGAKVPEADAWNVQFFLRAKEMWEPVRTTFMLCSRATDFNKAEESESMTKMLDLWGRLCANGGGNGSDVSSKFIRVDQFLSLSFAAESRRRGLYEPYFWTSPQHNIGHALLPLQFPEPLPSISLVDRAEIIRGRMESSNLNLQDVHAARKLLLPSDGRGKRPSMKNQSKEAAIVTGELGGIEIPVFEGELLVLVQSGGDSTPSQPSSRTPSRPPSSIVEGATVEKTFTRAPSIRVRPGSKAGLERKTSVARRNSLPSISNRGEGMITSESSSERPLRVRIKAGTLDRLVGILAHGLQGVSVAFADDNGEMPLRDGKHRDLRVDQADFSAVWWNTFRSFVTPLALFELLQKRYQQALVTSQTIPATRLVHAAQVRTELLETMRQWLDQGSGAEDFLGDPGLFDAFKSFLQSPWEHEALESYVAYQEPHVRDAWNSLDQTRKALAEFFAAQTQRPLSKTNPTLDLLSCVDNHNFGIDPPEIDLLDAEHLVNNIDAMVAAAFRNITDEDLLVTVDLLEIQSADRTGWFTFRDHSSVGDEVECQTMYTLIPEIGPTSLISDLGQDSLYRLFPGSIRSCIRAFGVIRRWIIAQIVASKLGLNNRQIRIETLLQCVEISRTRSLDPSSSGSIAEQPCIRSFVEAVVTSALLSPESRIHSRAWQNVANARGTSFDALTSLLNPPVTESIKGEPLTVDIGWLLERMLEVINMPDVLDSSEETQGMVNFEKRRYLSHLSTNVSSLSPARKGYHRTLFNIQDLKRLNNVEREASGLQFDFRIIREEAHREAFPGGTPGKKIPRPFTSLVIAQQEKNKRDRHLRDRLSKEKRHEQQRDKREEHLQKTMQQGKPQTAAQKQHRNKKSMSSAFFQFMRPISSAFSSDSLYTAGMKRSPAELDFTPANKPALVLSVAEAQVAQFINNERSFTFQLDTEDGGHFLLQAQNKKDMVQWINKINHVAKTAAKRRLTYMGNNAKPQLSDHLSSRPKTGSHDPTAVFGVDLQFLIRREADGDPQPGAIPLVVEQCINEVEGRGLTEVGIYRIAGAMSEINSLKEAFNRGESPIKSSTDIYAVCDVIKSYFRTLPDPVIPSSMYFDFIATAKIEDLEPRLDKIRNLVQSLPYANFDLLKRLIEHLDKVTDYEEMNQMTSYSLSIVISPNILRAPRDDFATTMANMGHAHGVAKALITHCHVIFSDADQEADNDDIEYDDFEPPIPEEDEEDEDEDEDDLLPALSVITSLERTQNVLDSLDAS